MSFRLSHLVMCATLAAATLSCDAISQGAANNQYLRFTQEHGLTFSEIGDPGNPDFVFQRIPGDPPFVFGGVDYRYRISTTEVTREQWFPFLNALAPHIYGMGFSPNDSAVLGGADWTGNDSNGVPRFRLLPQAAPLPAFVGWRPAALFTNWLHNGAPTGPDVPLSVFQNGAYDASTFTQNPDGSYNDQAARNPDAKFWIPTSDEWHKAGYWDPNRYGEDEGGWWLFPNATDERLTPGLPSEGGETNFGVSFNDAPGMPVAVGSYPGTQSPWGLLDVSGGGREWLEDVDPFVGPKFRGRIGTLGGSTESLLLRGDHLGWMYGDFTSVVFPSGVLRIAAAVPAPGAGGVLVVVALAAMTRRR